MSVKKLILAQFHKHTISLCSSLKDLLQGYCQSQMNNLDHNQLEREKSPSGNWLSTFFSVIFDGETGASESFSHCFADNSPLHTSRGL